MTVFLPLDPVARVPAQPAFVQQSSNVPAQTARAIQSIMKAKRIVVVCGAGISVQAGIPDFRSSEGLFQSLKRDNPKEAMSSGKELFDVSVFNSENKTSLFCQMIAQLSDLSQAAEPTAFHKVLRALDNRGRLLRVYTQNIDAIEQKCGLSFGVPEFEVRRSSKARPKNKAKATMEDSSGDPGLGSGSTSADSDAPSQPVASTSRLPSPPVEMPRCIPLHGTLQSMHCQVCNNSFPLWEHLPALASGQPPSCPECITLEEARQLVGKRPRGVGRLRPSVVLYNEAHRDGEGVGDVVQKDLIGSSKGKGKSGADLLLVVGTSLKVPGTKRMVREFAKAVKLRGAGISSSTVKEDSGSSGGSTLASRSFIGGLSTPTPSPRRSPMTAAGAEEDMLPVPKALYLNLDFPVPTREWEGVFDAWIQGDAQQFAEMLQAEIDKEVKTKEIATEKKRKREEEALALSKDELPDIGRNGEEAAEKNGRLEKETVKLPKAGKKKPGSSSKKRRTSIVGPPSPPYTPASPRRISHSPDPVDEDELDNLPQGDSSKLYLRIPARHDRATHVPGVYITSTPQYVMNYEFYGRPQRGYTPPPAPSYIQGVYGRQPSYTHQNHQLPSPNRSSQVSVRPTSPCPPDPPSPTTTKLNKRTKAGRKALREAQEARRVERLTREMESHHLPPPPPNRSYLPLRHRHQESFIRSSAAMYHHHVFPGEEDMDVDIDIETIGDSFSVDILRRTSRLGLCETS